MSPWVNGKTLDVDYDCTYTLISNIEIDVNTYGGLNGLVSGTLWTDTINGSMKGLETGMSTPYIEFVLIDPQEDDNYIYKPFSTYLKVGDNGEFGKNLYQYLDEFLPKGGASISEIPQIQEIVIQYSNSSSAVNRFGEYTTVMKSYDGGILFSISYVLYEDGRVSISEPT